MLSDINTLLIDLDGVMYRGERALPGASDLLPALHALGIQYTFVTNNSTTTAEEVVARLRRMGVPADAKRVVTSAQATAQYLGTVAAPGTRMLSIGEAGLSGALTAAGFQVADEDVAFVVVGLDRHVTYERLAKACMAIRAGAKFVATNADPGLPVEGGWWPGAGAIVAALVTATGVSPTIIGKPQPGLLVAALERLGVLREHAAMVGDQIHSDILAGKAAGVTTILVGTDRPTAEAEPTADLWVPDLPTLIATLRETHPV
ncbi:MAG: HAD-IIA family hydrolase [Chloroflexi bacterium]|nr:HAD-IIA family hydrolase [Chloroflexota bacterium]